MYPFECSKCRNRIYAPSLRLASCCTGAKLIPLVNICLLVPLEKMETNTHVHTTGESMLSRGGQKWCTACNASSLPKYVTPVIQAATCHKCLETYKQYKEKEEVKKEVSSLEDILKGIEFIDEENPDNSFKSEIKELKKEINSSEPAKTQEIFEKLKSLHEKMNHRKIVNARLQKLQEIRK